MPCIIFHDRVERTSVFGISAVSARLASYISYVRTEHISFAPTPTRGKLSLQTTAMADDENPDDGPGLIKLDMRLRGTEAQADVHQCLTPERYPWNVLLFRGACPSS